MNLLKYFLNPKKLVGIISSTLLVASVCPKQLLAQPLPMKISLDFPSGDSRGAPNSTIGGGRRGNSCITPDDEKGSVTALMPNPDNKSLTVSGTPEFYFYIPITTATTGEFILKSDGENIYEKSFKLPSKPGIVKLKIPAESALKIGSTYKWYFSIICNNDDRSYDEIIQGVIKRTAISESLNKDIQQTTPLKKAEIYAEHNIWAEVLSNISYLREPKLDEWDQLLKSVGLEKISRENVVDCCTSNPESK
jgi:hypothetical protein